MLLTALSQTICCLSCELLLAMLYGYCMFDMLLLCHWLLSGNQQGQRLLWLNHSELIRHLALRVLL